MRCSRCGTDARESARFCEDCGERLEIRCPTCGAPATPGKRFCGDCGAALGETQPVSNAPTPPPLPLPVSPREDERRWATILFADLYGFTAMSERMDPEDVKALAHRCSEQMSAAVRSFGGTVLNVMGDAIVASSVRLLPTKMMPSGPSGPGWPFVTAS